MLQNGNTVCETMSTSLRQTETEAETGQKETETFDWQRQITEDSTCRGMTEQDRQAAPEQTRLALRSHG